jgi:hypothetical protein
MLSGGVSSKEASPFFVFSHQVLAFTLKGQGPGTLDIASSTGVSIFNLTGSGTDAVTGLGNSKPLQTGSKLLEGSNGVTITSKRVLNLGTALLAASLPIISLIGTTTPADSALTTTGSTIELIKSNVTSLGPIIALDKGLITVNNGPLINLTSGSNMTVTGDFLSLINASKINVVNGPLIKVDGVAPSGSSPAVSTLSVSGALVNFGGTGGNTIIIKNDIVSTGSRGRPANDLFPVDVTGAGSSITIGSNPVKNSALGSITVTKTDGSAGGVLIQATGGGVVNITAP